MKKEDYDALSNYRKRKLKVRAKQFPKWWVAVAFFVSILVATGLFVMYVRNFGVGFSKEKSEWGAFGDYMGGILNPFFALFGFLGLLHTISLQNEQFSNSEENQAIQSFENLFTHMANELTKIYDDFRNKKQEHIVAREEMFGTFINQSKVSSNVYSNISGELHSTFGSIIPIGDITTQLRTEYKAVRYFMYLFQVLKLIDKNEYLDDERKKLYSNLIRAGIENDILQLLFLNCFYLEFYQTEFEYYHELVTKFSFFEHMTFTHNNGILEGLVYVSTLYNQQAFGQSIYYKNILINLLKFKNLNYRKFQGSDSSLLEIKDDLIELKNFKSQPEPISFFLTNFEVISKDFKTNSKSLIFSSIVFKIKNINLILYLTVSAKYTENCTITLLNDSNTIEFIEISEAKP